MNPLIEAVRKQNEDAVISLLDSGASPDCQDSKTGESALAISTWSGNLRIVELLLESGADPNYLQTVAWPIQLAAGSGHEEIVELLLQHDAEVEVQDEDGSTPLISASAGGHERIVELLLEAGANARHKGPDNRRALLYAAEKGHGEVVELLAPLSTAKDRKQAELILQLAKQGPLSGEARQFFQDAESGNLEGVKSYLEAGGDVNVMNESGETALFGAARRDRYEVAEILVANGADVDHLDVFGGFPLIYAGNCKDARVYPFLFEKTSKQLQQENRKRSERAQQIAQENGLAEYFLKRKKT